MPPHCDSVDGPVAVAARQALEHGDVDLALPFVPEEAEAEVRRTFAAVMPVRALGDEAREVAERLFLETVVRLHRQGEGAPYTGLKEAGLSVGPVIPLAESALAMGDVQPVADFLCRVVRDELVHRLDLVEMYAGTRRHSVADARRYVEAMLGFEVYAHHVHQALLGPVHPEGHGHPH